MYFFSQPAVCLTLPLVPPSKVQQCFRSVIAEVKGYEKRQLSQLKSVKSVVDKRTKSGSGGSNKEPASPTSERPRRSVYGVRKRTETTRNSRVILLDERGTPLLKTSCVGKPYPEVLDASGLRPER